MNGPIESAPFAAKRRSGESEVRFDYVFSGYPEQAFLYENTILALSVRFPGLYVEQTFSVLNVFERVIEQPINVGIVLAKGELKREIDRRLGASHSSFTADDVVRDVYELLLELFRGDPVRKSHRETSDAPLHIYEIDGRQLWDAINNGPANLTYGLEALAAWPATLVI